MKCLCKLVFITMILIFCVYTICNAETMSLKQELRPFFSEEQIDAVEQIATIYQDAHVKAVKAEDISILVEINEALTELIASTGKMQVSDPFEATNVRYDINSLLYHISIIGIADGLYDLNNMLGTNASFDDCLVMAIEKTNSHIEYNGEIVDSNNVESYIWDCEKKIYERIMSHFVMTQDGNSEITAEPKAGPTMCTVTEETKGFNPSAYETAKNYKYDKFDKEWKAYATYQHDYSDAKVVFGLTIVGTNKSITFPPYIYVWVREVNNIDTKFRITGLQLLVDEKVFSIKEMLVNDSMSSIFLNRKTGKELLEEITKSEELDYKLIFATGSYVDTITGNDYEEIKQLAQLILDNNAWEYVLDESNGKDMKDWDDLLNSKYPIEISD